MDFHLQAFLVPGMSFLIISRLISSFQNLFSWPRLTTTSWDEASSVSLYCPAEVGTDLRILCVSCTYFSYNRALSHDVYLFSYLFPLWGRRTLLRSRKLILRPQLLAQCLPHSWFYSYLLDEWRSWGLVCEVSKLHAIQSQKRRQVMQGGLWSAQIFQTDRKLARKRTRIFNNL